MTENKLLKLYFKWLLDFVCDSTEKEDYELVFEDLFNKDFFWLIDYDENLAIYGLDLRNQFLESNQTYRKMLDIYGGFDENDKKCSVLEMMVALSILIEEKIMTNYEENNTPKWFWEMINALGLDHYAGLSYDELEVDDILEKFLNRMYKKNGRGGLFIVKNSEKDMTKMDIWMQMNAFLIEKKVADW